MPGKIFITMKPKNCFIVPEGSIKVIVQEDERKELELHAGDMYLHQSKMPHSHLVRSEGSIGLVIERRRAGKRIYGWLALVL
jgi:mannose-6-phosphate isomerase-like protein (cupin superfamily)